MSERVTLTDVTLRDGLQEEDVVVPTAAKQRLAEALVAAGFRSLELTSFVHPAWVPQLADAEELLRAFPARAGLVRQALVPNRKGLERAVATDAECLNIVISASTAHNEANIHRTTEQSLAEAPTLIALAHEAGRRVRGCVATAFGCPFRGEVTDAQVFAVVDTYLEAGAEEIVLADTMGAAREAMFAARLEQAVRRIGDPRRVGLHLHDGGNGELTKLVLRALAVGVRSFDVAIGGLGGCPFAPGAPGNARAEQLIPVMEQAGFATGVQVDLLPQIALSLGLALGQAPPAPKRQTAARA
jgi:hydroxymethylglutaryl-CoA lyase